MRDNIKMIIEIEDDFIMNVIHDVFDRYSYNVKFKDSDKIKDIILNQFKNTYDNKNLIARDGYNLNMKSYVSTSVRGFASSMLWEMKKNLKI